MLAENILIGEGTKYPLKGVLTLPDNLSVPVPAVVLIHGSGSSNMDEKVGKLTPFKDIAEGLAHYGVASIRYDKRSFAHGLKMVRDKNLTITAKEETIDDAVLATQLLKSDSRIDSSKVFVIGHSMGGTLAPRIDAEGGDYCGFIIMAGTPRRLEDVMKEQLAENLDQMNPILRKIASGSINKMLKKFDGMYDLSDEEAKKIKIGNGTTAYYFKDMGQPTVAEYLAENHKPMLIMQGAKDFQVKADVDFVMYKEILKDRDNVTFKLYENLNHAFVNSVYGLISKAKQEYNTEQHIGENVIADIAGWIKTVTE